MNRLIFATHNIHKLQEIQNIVGDLFQIVSLDDLGVMEEIPETASSLEGNAQMKAEYINERYDMDCFSDDTGLEIEALNNAPGVYSARYAGEHCSFEDNIVKVLFELKGVSNRKARFRSIICLIMNGKKYFFEGKIEGVITTEKHGRNGFGYDSVFLPNGYTQTFAEMPLALKNQISHRGIATQKLTDFLKSLKE
jgi:XTP/dITP diphosphohydrolase